MRFEFSVVFPSCPLNTKNPSLHNPWLRARAFLKGISMT